MHKHLFVETEQLVFSINNTVFTSGSGARLWHDQPHNREAPMCIHKRSVRSCCGVMNAVLDHHNEPLRWWLKGKQKERRYKTALLPILVETRLISETWNLLIAWMGIVRDGAAWVYDSRVRHAPQTRNRWDDSHTHTHTTLPSSPLPHPPLLLHRSSAFALLLPSAPPLHVQTFFFYYGSIVACLDQLYW